MQAVIAGTPSLKKSVYLIRRLHHLPWRLQQLFVQTVRPSYLQTHQLVPTAIAGILAMAQVM
jgi:hypothetical protein